MSWLVASIVGLLIVSVILLIVELRKSHRNTSN